MFIKTKIFVSICSSIDQHNNVRELIKAIDEQCRHSDITLASTIIKKFSSLKLTRIKSVWEHIM